MTIRKWISPALAIAVVAMLGCNDVPEVQSSSLLSVYPNPVSNDATIFVPNANRQDFDFKMFDTKGKLIVEERSNLPNQTYPIPMVDRPTGTYTIVFVLGSTVTTEKLIKI